MIKRDDNSLLTSGGTINGNVTVNGSLSTSSAVMPTVDEGSNLGSSSFRWGYVFGSGLKDNNGSIRVGCAGNTGNNSQGAVGNGAAAIANKFGNVNALSTAGAKIAAFYSDNLSTEKLAVGKNGQFHTPTGQADSVAGTATLVGGTVTVNTTAVSASSLIFVSRNTPGGTEGHLSAPVASIVAATSFVINSSSGSDTSTVNWWIVN